MKFWATIEYVTNRRAIVELSTTTGEWSGYSRIDLPRNARGSRAALYEAGYAHASAMADIKGGTLDRYAVVAHQPRRCRRVG